MSQEIEKYFFETQRKLNEQLARYISSSKSIQYHNIYIMTV